MKLSQICESLSGDPAIVTKASKILGDLIKYTYETESEPEIKALESYLKDPSAKTWLNTKWIIDSLTKHNLNSQQDQSRVAKWNELKTITPSTVTAALYTVPPTTARGTPLQSIIINQQMQKKLKSALGPQGFVSMLSNAEDVPASKLKQMMKDTAANQKVTEKSIEKDMPNLKQIKDY